MDEAAGADRPRVSDKPVAVPEPGGSDQFHESVAVRWTLFGEQEFATGELSPGDQLPVHTDERVLWLDVAGIPERELLAGLQEQLGLHPLALEDVQNPRQQPKAEDYEHHLFCVVRRPVADGDDGHLAQDCLFLGPDFLVTLHPEPGLLAPVHRRLAEPRGRLRRSGADSLFYACLDLLVDQGFVVAELHEAALQELEDRLFADRTADLTASIYSARRRLGALHRSLSQQTRMLEWLSADSAFINDSHEHYLRDCQDHSRRLQDSFLHLHEAAGDLLHTQLALASHRMADVMRVLTVMATIFIPLTFVTGIYGMNFDTASPFNMPELGWRFGYPLVMIFMALVGGGLVWYFRRKRWL